MPQSGGKATFLHILERIVTGRVSCKFDKSASALEIYEQVTNFDVFNELLVQKRNLSDFNKTFSPMPRKLKLLLLSATS